MTTKPKPRKAPAAGAVSAVKAPDLGDQAQTDQGPTDSRRGTYGHQLCQNGTSKT
jgi:hypothetical protein